ncbi:uncharacterized protein BJ171DRAFT_581714 [Polychytrium aggregatum]|uniref:uncharacterized protein n=1 Tax=Polychytrium aggregatum TaxID=110093 RepID=UPI0022FE1A5B|nr:uncharacterized protein BJ171DRAFT_581714 [Polychytrium aggregatum]KAI9204560.1 hypothetical protein BJ171DRAFT_581714 [Polychytrium aggregatum]
MLHNLAPGEDLRHPRTPDLPFNGSSPMLAHAPLAIPSDPFASGGSPMIMPSQPPTFKARPSPLASSSTKFDSLSRKPTLPATGTLGRSVTITRDRDAHADLLAKLTEDALKSAGVDSTTLSRSKSVKKPPAEDMLSSKPIPITKPSDPSLFIPTLSSSPDTQSRIDTLLRKPTVRVRPDSSLPSAADIVKMIQGLKEKATADSTSDMGALDQIAAELARLEQSNGSVSDVDIRKLEQQLLELEELMKSLSPTSPSAPSTPENVAPAPPPTPPAKLTPEELKRRREVEEARVRQEHELELAKALEEESRREEQRRQEEARLREQELERQRLHDLQIQEERERMRIEKIKREEEAEAQRLEEREAKRRQEEQERLLKIIQEEERLRKLQEEEEAEKRRLVEEEKAREAERKRQEELNEKRRREEREAKHRREEEERRRKQLERQRALEEEERLRQEQERREYEEEQRRIALERKRQQEEQEAERRRLEEEEAERKRLQEAAELRRKQEEAAELKRREEAELKRKLEEEERIRKVEAERKRLEEEEKRRLKEEQRQREELEVIRQQEEEIRRRHEEELEILRLAEVKRKQEIERIQEERRLLEERIRREEEEKQQILDEQKRQEERLRQEKEELEKRIELERKAREEEEQRLQEEKERQRLEEQRRQQEIEDLQKRLEMEARKRQDELEERLRQNELKHQEELTQIMEERKRLEQEVRLKEEKARQEAEEQRKRDEEDRRRRDEERRLQEEEAKRRKDEDDRRRRQREAADGSDIRREKSVPPESRPKLEIPGSGFDVLEKRGRVEYSERLGRDNASGKPERELTGRRHGDQRRPERSVERRLDRSVERRSNRPETPKGNLDDIFRPFDDLEFDPKGFASLPRPSAQRPDIPPRSRTPVALPVGGSSSEVPPMPRQATNLSRSKSSGASAARRPTPQPVVTESVSPPAAKMRVEDSSSNRESQSTEGDGSTTSNERERKRTGKKTPSGGVFGEPHPCVPPRGNSLATVEKVSPETGNTIAVNTFISHLDTLRGVASDKEDKTATAPPLVRSKSARSDPRPPRSAPVAIAQSGPSMASTSSPERSIPARAPSRSDNRGPLRSATVVQNENRSYGRHQAQADSSANPSLHRRQRSEGPKPLAEISENDYTPPPPRVPSRNHNPPGTIGDGNGVIRTMPRTHAPVTHGENGGSFGTVGRHPTRRSTEFQYLQPEGEGKPLKVLIETVAQSDDEPDSRPRPSLDYDDLTPRYASLRRQRNDSTYHGPTPPVPIVAPPPPPLSQGYGLSSSGGKDQDDYPTLRKRSTSYAHPHSTAPHPPHGQHGYGQSPTERGQPPVPSRNPYSTSPGGSYDAFNNGPAGPAPWNNVDGKRDKKNWFGTITRK